VGVTVVALTWAWLMGMVALSWALWPWPSAIWSSRRRGGGRESKSSRNVSFPLSRNLSSFFAPIIQGTKRNPDYSSWQQQSKEEKEGRRKEVGDRAEDDVPCFSTDSVDVPGDTPHVPHETPHNTQGTPHEPQAGSHVPQD
jgi:hypothetical protein